MIGILTEVSNCQSSRNLLARKMSDYRMDYNHDPVSRIISMRDVKFYGMPFLDLDPNSVLKTIELIRHELDSYSRNRLTLMSAFTGGLAGAIVTLIVSHVL